MYDLKNSENDTELLSEITDKYCAGPIDAIDQRWEMRGFEKVYDKQSDIFRLKCIVVSQTNVSFLDMKKFSLNIRFNMCTELDISKTRMTKWMNILEILTVFPSLKILRLDNNLIESLTKFLSQHKILTSLPQITHLSMNYCGLSSEDACTLTTLFQNLKEIYLEGNFLDTFEPEGECLGLRIVDIQSNPIRSFSNIQKLLRLPTLKSINLSSCEISIISSQHFTSNNIISRLEGLVLQNNLIKDWSCVDTLEKLTYLKRLILKGVPLPGARGVDIREIVIAKLPSLIELDKCDISPVERRSAELLYFSRFSDHTPPEHQETIARLNKIYGDWRVNPSEKTQILAGKINSKRVLLTYREQVIEKELSLALSIHRIVGTVARLFKFDPDEIKGIELRRNVNGKKFPPEQISRTRDNLLRQFDLNDGDIIAFI